MYDTILVPTDGSEPANRAVEHALKLGEHYEAAVHAMYVVDTGRYGDPALSSAELVLTELEEEGQAIVDAVADRGDDRGLAVETCVCHGRPDEEITDYADEVDADVIVMGFQGQSHTRTDLIGSVAQRVLQSTDRAVLTV